MDNFFSANVIRWYQLNKRDLPWRGISDPYKIWVSEVILQQTRIVQGYDYYLRFLDKFPTIASLANASEDEVLLVWQGLGYYSRARNMHAAAKQVMTEFNGSFPNTYEGIRSLKGVGDYTAAAVASFAFHLPHAVLDGNVFRVLSRFFMIDTPIDTTSGKKEFQALAQELMDEKHPELYNQGVMDIGATVCLPQNPLCTECPLAEGCLAVAQKRQTDYPAKSKKIQTKERYFVYFVVNEEDTYYLHRRDNKDIWAGLYEFPLMELASTFDENKDLSSVMTFFRKEFTNITIESISPEMKHVLTHQTLHAWFITGSAKLVHNDSKYIRVNRDEIENYAVSKLTNRYWERRK